ncbi:MAG: RsmE family RNA methyltransferase [Candidatus Omnitrophota bacterium]
MVRLFLPCLDSKKKSVSVNDKENLHYLLNVLRVKCGQGINIFNGHGAEFIGSIKEINQREIFIKITRKIITLVNDFKITLACAIPKKAKFDFIVEKATELGVETIIPLKTDHGIVNLDNERFSLKLVRWRKIAQEASRQSHRVVLPRIEGLLTFDEVITRVKSFELAMLACLSEKRIILQEALKNSKAKNVLVFIGPEGDFSQKEILKAKQAGCIPVSFGKEVLKVDTAALYVISILKFLSYKALSNK